MIMVKVLNAAVLVIAQLIALVPTPLHPVASPEQPPIVQAILFYSPSCPHCHQVIDVFLIPFQETNGEQVQIIGIDTSHPVGGELYGRAIEWFAIPESRHGVPMLIVGKEVLVGGNEIPSLFPGIVEVGLASGGIGWPAIPDLAVSIPDLPPSAKPATEPEITPPPAVEPASTAEDVLPLATEIIPSTQTPSPESIIVTGGKDTPGSTAEETLDLSDSEPAPSQGIGSLDDVDTDAMLSETESPPADPVGFTLAAIVLIGMIATLIYTLWLMGKRLQGSKALPYHAAVLPWTIPFLAVFGLGVSLYLSYVEVGQVKAVCGPIGECNIVQASEYAQLMGIPIAVLGTLTYITVLALWAGQRYLPARQGDISFTCLIALTIFCTLFSIYLTVIELFAIGAVCAWCLGSAVISTLLMILAVTAMSKNQPQIRWKAQTKSSERI
jgi:uncharacterized membrane protein